MKSEIINNLISKGFNRWTKGDLDRLYVDPKVLGLDYVCYKTGNIRSATFQGEGISNSKAYKMRSAKTYIDVKTGKVYSDIDIFKEIAERMIKEAK